MGEKTQSDSTRGVKTTTHHMNCFKAQRIMGHRKLLRHRRLIGKKNTFTSQLFSGLLKMTKKISFILSATRHSCTSVSLHFQVNEREKYLRKDSSVKQYGTWKKAFTILSIVDF